MIISEYIVVFGLGFLWGSAVTTAALLYRFKPWAEEFVDKKIEEREKSHG